MIFFSLLLFFLELSNEQLLKINYISEITITINGTGNQSILSDGIHNCDGKVNFTEIPSQILVNGVLQNYTGKIVYNLIKEVNNITMIWNYTITNCNVMFSNLNNITKIDLSKFDSSKVTDMRCMFSNCYSLQSLDLNNFNTSSVTNMIGMFYNCISLKTLDLNSFNTSNVNNMKGMFYGCESLISLDLSNFDTSNVIKMDFMFYQCTSLIKLNLKNFNTQKVGNNLIMFLKKYNLQTYLSY